MVDFDAETILEPSSFRTEVNRFAIFEECPMCDGRLEPEHAHYRCGSCGWRDSCCD